MNPNLGPQFHVTTHELADQLLKQGEFKVGGPSGFGGDAPVHNQGAGVYTAPRFAVENHWAGEIASSPGHEGNDNLKLKYLRVDYPKDAKVHVVDTSKHFYTRNGDKRRNAEGIASHLREHPDVAAHYVPDPGEFGTASLTTAAHKAGYDAVAYQRGGTADETVWNPASAHRLKPRELPPTAPKMTYADQARHGDHLQALRQEHGYKVGQPHPPELDAEAHRLAGTAHLRSQYERDDWGEHR